MIFQVTQESINREVFRIEADTQERAIEIAMERYSGERENVRSDYEVVYRCEEKSE